MSNTDAPNPELQDLTEQLQRDAAEVREAYRKLKAVEDVAWTRYVADVDATLLQMEHDLKAEHDVLVAERAVHSAELGQAVHELLDRIRGGLEELRVQEVLFEMDARDRFGELWNTGQHALADLRATVSTTLDVAAFVAR
jgi:hypothetical protein